MRRLLVIVALVTAVSGGGAGAVGVSDTVTTYAGTGSTGFNGDGIVAAAANLGQPMDIEVSAGDLYIAEQLGNRVRKVAIATGLVTTVAGTGVYSGNLGDGGPATDAEIGGVTALALDDAGNLYIGENVGDATGRVRKVAAATGVITTLRDLGSGRYVADLEVGPDGGVYVSDLLYPGYPGVESRVVRLHPDTGALTLVAGNGTAGFSGDGGPAVDAQLTWPTGLAFDGSGNLYVADGNRVRRIDTGGVITTVAGTGTASSAGDGGPAAAADLNRPWAIAVDADGDLHVGEWDGRKVRTVDAATATIATTAGTGVAGFAGDGGPAGAAEFDTPASLAVGTDGRLYVSDTYNHRIRVVTPSDTTPPLVVCSPPAAGLWYAEDVAVPCTASDPGSGLAADGDASFSLSTSVPSGTETAVAATGTRTVADNAGNTAAVGPYTFMVDRKGPSVTCDSVPALLLDEAGATVGATVADGGSGAPVAHVTVTADTGSVGVRWAALTGRDAVGNDTTAACEYRVGYVFGGFAPPLADAPAVTAARAGRTIPVRWRLEDAAGAPAGGLDAVTAIVVKPTSCAVFTTDPAGATAATTRSGVRLEPGTGRFHVNWVTPGPGCYTLFLRLDSGQALPAFVRLR